MRSNRSLRDRDEQAEIEAAAVARDEAMLLSAMRNELWRSLATKMPLGGELVDVADFQARPAPQRVVVQNWRGRADVVPLGDVRLQLEPGQAVTLWVDGALGGSLESEDSLQDALSILADDEGLVG